MTTLSPSRGEPHSVKPWTGSLTSKSSVSSRMRVASLEAWGSVAICLVHSDTVFVSLVVRGSAALISTSAASHTYTQHNSSSDHVSTGKVFSTESQTCVH